jgi:aspartyl-tRNA(Asn)/glutamyl-tRNA(Gln) amidotransferase subunit A
VRPALRPVPELSAALAAGALSSRDLVEDCLAAVAERGAALGAFLSVDADGARAGAAAADARRAGGARIGPLDGIPFALKDNIVARGLPATCGSRILERFVSPYDATAVERLRAAGAVLLGKTNLDEFAMGSSTEHSAFGPARNPHDPARVPGGSSGGSCAAVAAGRAPLAVGSDTGGSVRLPASFCGVVGMKPGYGRVSRYGLVAFGSSLDQIGPVARTVGGVAAALQAIAGADPRDATSNPAPVPDLVAAAAAGAAGDLAGVRVGVLRDLPAGGDPEVTARVAEAVAALAAAGAEIVDVRLPSARHGVAAYYVVAGAEASSNLARFDGARYGRRAEGAHDLEELDTASRSEGFGDEVKRRILLGTFALSAGYYDAYYGRAMRARARIKADFDDAFLVADVIASPVAATPAFAVGERTDDPLAMYLTDALTIPANLAGIPAISVPCGVTSGKLPVGLQLQAPALREDLLLRVAAAYEAAAGAAAPPAMAAGGAA